MTLGESLEDYLEALLILGKKGGTIRSVELASFMNYSKPSITHAVKVLSKRGLVIKSDDGEINLTKEGNEIALKIYERHCFFYSLLYEAGIDEENAQHDACRMEHTLSEESFQKLKDKLMELKSLMDVKNSEKKE